MTNDIDISNDFIDQIDVDKLDSDPNEQAKLKYALEAEHYRRNIMPLSEFEQHYAVLFKRDVMNTSKKEYQELSQEYLYRIDPYYPVYIIRERKSDKVSELLKEENVVYIFPPLFNRVGTVNNLGKDGINIMQAFNNLASNGFDDQFNRKKELYSKYLSVVFRAMTDSTTFEANRAIAKNMAERTLQRAQEMRRNPDNTLSGTDVQDVPAEMLDELGYSKEVTNEKIAVVEEEEYL